MAIRGVRPEVAKIKGRRRTTPKNKHQFWLVNTSTTKMETCHGLRKVVGDNIP